MLISFAAELQTQLHAEETLEAGGRSIQVRSVGTGRIHGESE